MSTITDVYLIETGDGGDVVLQGNDIKLIGGLENMIYIALFGGNPGNSTFGPKEDEQVFDFWGNFMLHPSEREVWFNSTLEYLLENTAITSSGRYQLEQAVLNDLQFMTRFAKVSASVQLIGIDKVKIDVIVMEPSTQTSTEFSYIWNATNQEIDTLPTSSTNGQGVALNNLLNFNL